MSILARSPRTLDPSHGGRGTLPPLPNGGGGGGGGRGDSNQPDYGWRLRRYRIGMFFALISISVLFVTLTAGFLLLKSGNKYNPYTNRYEGDWAPIAIPKPLLLFDTILLLASSFVLECGRRRARLETVVVPASRIPGVLPIPEHSRRWVFATLALGSAFLVGQWRAWQWLRAHDLFQKSGAASSFVFLLTGTHAVHLIGGIIVLLYACFLPDRQDSLYRRSMAIDVTSWYWHFMSLVWVYILGLFWFFA
jgi:cytochrome c oxidase subunit 3